MVTSNRTKIPVALQKRADGVDRSGSNERGGALLLWRSGHSSRICHSGRRENGVWTDGPRRFELARRRQVLGNGTMTS